MYPDDKPLFLILHSILVTLIQPIRWWNSCTILTKNGNERSDMKLVKKQWWTHPTHLSLSPSRAVQHPHKHPLVLRETIATCAPPPEIFAAAMYAPSASRCFRFMSSTSDYHIMNKYISSKPSFCDWLRCKCFAFIQASWDKHPWTLSHVPSCFIVQTLCASQMSLYDRPFIRQCLKCYATTISEEHPGGLHLTY